MSTWFLTDWEQIWMPISGWGAYGFPFEAELQCPYRERQGFFRNAYNPNGKQKTSCNTQLTEGKNPIDWRDGVRANRRSRWEMPPQQSTIEECLAAGSGNPVHKPLRDSARRCARIAFFFFIYRSGKSRGRLRCSSGSAPLLFETVVPDSFFR